MCYIQEIRPSGLCTKLSMWPISSETNDGYEYFLLHERKVGTSMRWFTHKLVGVGGIMKWGKYLGSPLSLPCLVVVVQSWILVFILLLVPFSVVATPPLRFYHWCFLFLSQVKFFVSLSS